MELYFSRATNTDDRRFSAETSAGIVLNRDLYN